MKCRVNGCDNLVDCRGYCGGHVYQYKKYGKIVHSKLRYNDGRTSHKLYTTWLSMKDRCNNPNNKSYHNYGDRGIRVCDRWTDWSDGFKNFLEDMGKRPEGCSLDRIDNNSDYSPDNCRWVDKVKQNLNKRGNLDEPYISTRKRGNRTQYVVRIKDLRVPNGRKVWTIVRTNLEAAIVAREELLKEMKKEGAR